MDSSNWLNLFSLENKLNSKRGIHKVKLKHLYIVLIILFIVGVGAGVLDVKLDKDKADNDYGKLIQINSP